MMTDTGAFTYNSNRPVVFEIIAELLARGLDKDENDKKGKLIRQERYAGSMQRSFYVGENLTEEDIKASFKHGVLSLIIPKKEAPKLPEKKQILIEG